jgi:hypothetical protein
MNFLHTQTALCWKKLNLLGKDHIVLFYLRTEIFIVVEIFATLSAIRDLISFTISTDEIVLGLCSYTCTFKMKDFWAIFTDKHVTILVANMTELIREKAVGILIVISRMILLSMLKIHSCLLLIYLVSVFSLNNTFYVIVNLLSLICTLHFAYPDSFLIDHYALELTA